jgi:N-acetylmuramoyl-L-alanine amidase
VTAFLSKTDAEVKDNGVKTAPLIVLAATEMPAILAEIGCLSNEDEARLLLDPRHLQNIARGLFVGIRAYAGARNRWAGTGSL